MGSYILGDDTDEDMEDGIGSMDDYADEDEVGWVDQFLFCLKNFCTSLAQSKNFFKSHSIILKNCLMNEYYCISKSYYRILILISP